MRRRQTTFLLVLVLLSAALQLVVAARAVASEEASLSTPNSQKAQLPKYSPRTSWVEVAATFTPRHVGSWELVFLGVVSVSF